MNRILIILSFMLVSFATTAETFTVDGLRYETLGNNKVSLLPKTDSYYGEKYQGNIVIPESVEYNENTYTVVQIGKSTFSNCMSITSVEMPNSIIYIDENAFYYSSIDAIKLSSNLLEIAATAFQGCLVEKIALPQSLKTIGRGAFYGCDKLTSISLPEGVRTLERETFFECSSLRDVYIGSNVDNFGDNVFGGCSSLETIKVSQNNSNFCVEDGVLYNADKSDLIVFPMGKYTFFEIPEGVKRIESGAFYGSSKLTNLIFPESLESIGYSCFAKCTALESIILPKSLREISYSSFKDCINLKSVIFSEATSILGSYCFQGCTSLSSVVFPFGIKTIESYCFSGCSKLRDITISGYLSIENKVFEKCNAIENIYCNTARVPNAPNAFDDNTTRWASLYVPSIALEIYKTSPGWKEFKNIVSTDYLPPYDIEVTSNGYLVENGDVLDVPYEYEDYSYPEYGMYYYTFIWDPNLCIASTIGNKDVDVTVTSLDDTEGIQLCWPGQCHFVEAGGLCTSSGSIGTTPVDLQIHKEVAFEEPGVILEKGGSAKVTIMSDSGIFECTVNFLLEDANGVGENFAESNLPTTYYTLEGIQIEKPTAKGMYIVRKGNKSKVMLKK